MIRYTYYIDVCIQAYSGGISSIFLDKDRHIINI